MKNTERFSDRVEDYVRYRPHYPPEIISFLKEQLGLNSQWTIADIGSGTGISSELFLQNGNTVYAVEPNQNMRKAAESLFKNNKKFISIDATAETTSLSNESIDLIVSGQAFHWFDKTASKKEFQRIARPDAYLLLMWNDRKEDSEFLKMYEKMLVEFALEYKGFCQRIVDETSIRNFFEPCPYTLKIFSNSQYFDLEGLKGRLLSSSYAPQKGHANYQPIMRRLKEIFDRFSVNGLVNFEYRCKLYYGKIRC